MRHSCWTTGLSTLTLVRRTRRSLNTMILCAAFAGGCAADAAAEADGPDAWRVRGVSPEDRLNIRMGPGTAYPVTGSLGPQARGLRAVTCVPLHTPAQYQALSPAERERLPPRWCLVLDRDGQKGWVAQRFLAEDTVAGGSDLSDDLPQRARALVQKLYDEAAASSDRLGPLMRQPERFFLTGIAEEIRGRGITASPLYGGQDANIRDLRISLDPDRPMFRGMVTVVVEFRNFGQPQTVLVRLRADPRQEGAPRIFRIEHEGWAFP